LGPAVDEGLPLGVRRQEPDGLSCEASAKQEVGPTSPLSDRGDCRRLERDKKNISTQSNMNLWLTQNHKRERSPVYGALTAEGGCRPGLLGLGDEALPLFVWLFS
jgi:hypothetical protein